MTAAGGNSPDLTNLKPCDHQAFFEALDSPPSPTEVLRAAFLRQKGSLVDLGANTPSTD
jgi:hypothetical protein